MIKREEEKEEKKKMVRKEKEPKEEKNVKDRETGARRDSRTVHFWEFFSAPNEKRRTLKNIDELQTKEL
jgi:hypothetical protein